MTKDKLNKLLKDYDKHRGSGEFSPASEFKEKFFEIIDDRAVKIECRRKPVLWLVATVSAIAAAILFTIVPFNVVTDAPVKKIKKNFASSARKLMQRLKKVFPERSVGLCIINNELKTFDANEEAPRNILINYFIQRKSDGKEIELSIATSSDNSSEINSSIAKGSIWVYQPDSNILTVDTDLALQLDPKTTIKISESNLLKFNKKQLVSSLRLLGILSIKWKL